MKRSFKQVNALKRFITKHRSGSLWHVLSYLEHHQAPQSFAAAQRNIRLPEGQGSEKVEKGGFTPISN